MIESKFINSKLNAAYKFPVMTQVTSPTDLQGCGFKEFYDLSSQNNRTTLSNIRDNNLQ
jgi:hypothetical protein